MSKEVYSLTEPEFLEALATKLRETGNLADVFRQMVTFNVPLFVLGIFAPDKKKEWLASDRELSFCIAEDGWKGRTKNLKSTFEKNQTDGFDINFSKSYCMLTDNPETTMLVFCKQADDENTFAIAPILADSKKQIWQSRDETSGLFKRSDNQQYDHYRVKGEIAINSDELVQIDRLKYKPLGLEIPKREITSLSVLALAQAESKGIAVPDEIQEQAELIKTGRLEPKINRTVLGAAASCLDFFERQNLKDVHPLWQKMDIFSRILPKPRQ